MLTPVAGRTTLASDPVYHDLGELVLNGLYGPIRIDDPHSARLFGCEREKFPTDLSVGLFWLPVQPVLFPPIGSPPGQTHWNWEIEYECEIRRKPACCDFVGLPQPQKIKAPP